jgi:type 1 glutamine amidotransferase
MRRTWVFETLVAAGLLTLIACSPERASTSTPPPPTGPSPTVTPSRVLVVTHTTGFRHPSIPVAETVLGQLARTSGLFTVQFARTAGDVGQMMTVEALARQDAVIFANTTGNLGIPSVRDFLDWVAAGHGFAGMHGASDTYHDEPGYLAMLGNQFQTHGDESAVDAVVETSAHPASAPLGTRFRSFDEIYRFARQNRGEVTMLLSLDRHPADGLPNAGQPADLPLAWAKSHGAGRVFYTALGHRDDVWTNALYQQHILGGIRWVLER